MFSMRFGSRCQPMSTPARSAIWNGPMGIPNSTWTRSTCSGVAPSSRSLVASIWRGISIRLPMKPWHTPATTGTFRMRLPSVIAVSSTSGAVFSPRTTSSSFITLAGEKKCMPTTSAGSRGGSRDLVEVEVGRVGSEDRAGLGDLVEPAEHLLLHVHVLVHRLDDEVAVGERGEIERRRQQPHGLGHLLFGQLPLRRAGLVILAHQAGAAVERLVAHLDDRHGDARRQEVHRNAAAHRAGADHSDLADRARFGVFGQAIDLGRLALGEEEIALRRRLLAAHQLHEQFALFDNAFRIRLLAGDLHRLDVGLAARRSRESAWRSPCGTRRTRSGSHSLSLSCRSDDFGSGRTSLTSSAYPTACGMRSPSISRSIRPQANPSFAPIGIAGGAHFERLLHSGDAREPLRSSRSREQPKLDLGRTELRGRIGNAVMARKRDFEAAAERGAVDRRDDGLAAIFNGVDHRGKPRLLRRLAELGDVRARKKSLAFAGDDDGIDGVVGLRLRRSRRPGPAGPPSKAR